MATDTQTTETGAGWTDPAYALMVKFLRYSLEPIAFKYDDLTDTEKSLGSRTEFEAMVQRINPQ